MRRGHESTAASTFIISSPARAALARWRCGGAVAVAKRFIRMTKHSFPLLALAAALAAPATAQYAAAPANDADQLAAEMRVIGANPTDVAALTQAGELSTRLGDLSGAASLFARADKVDPRNGRVKAGMAGVLLHLERPGEALQFYNQAEGYGYPVARFAADRGLAYDLVAQQGRAQRDYRLALAGGAADDETVRRYALSLGISGQKEAALQQLDPLLRRSDRAGWRARAFVLAMNGESGAAQTIATTMMAPGQASGMAAFFARLPALGPADRAFAVQFGELRPTPQRLADLRLAPALPALAAEIVPVARAVAPVQVAAVRVDKRRRGKKGEVRLAVVAPPPVAPPLPAPPAFGARVLASGPALASRTLAPGFGAGVPATRVPVAIAALGPRVLPSSYGALGGGSRPSAAVAPLASRVLPARSPLPPPPILSTPGVALIARQPTVSGALAAVPARLIAVAPPRTSSIALAKSIPSPSPSPPAPATLAPVALAQATSPRTGGYVTFERPGSMLPGYLRLPAGSPSVVTPPRTVVAQSGRVTGTLSAPAPTIVTPPTIAPALTTAATQASSAAVPGFGGLSATTMTSNVSALPLSPERVAFAPARAMTLTAPPTAGAGSAVAQVAGGGSQAAAVSPTTRDALPAAAAPSGLASAPVPDAAPVQLAAALPPGGALPNRLGVSQPGGLGAGATVVQPRGEEPSGLVAATVSPVHTGLTINVSPVPSSVPALASHVVAPPLDAGIAPVSGTMTSQPTTSGITPAPSGETVAGFSPTSVAITSPAPADPVASGEPAGVAVSPAMPASDGVLARIVAALPVPASELNIAPTAAVPKRTGQGARRQLAALASDAPAQPHSTGTASGDDADPARRTPSTSSGRHKSATTDDPAPGTRKHAAAAADDAPVAKAKGRKGTAVAEDAAPNTRKGGASADAPAKGRHATLAKADEDTPPAHGKHGRHDASDDDSKKPTRTGKKALAAQHEVEPQKYWVQVAGGANEASLGKAWQIAQGKAPALAGRKGYTTPLHATNRVLAGPFKSDDEARQFVNTLNKQGVHAFQFTNDKGQKVKKLDDE